MRRLTLDGLEILDAIDRRGSFSGAAEELHKVPSTISYSVARLEEDLGLALFIRTGPRVDLTAAGRELVKEGRLLLQAADDLECRVKRVASGWESEFRLALDSLLPTAALSRHVQAFCKAAESTRLRLIHETLSGTWEALLDGRADLVVAAGEGPSGGGYKSVVVADLGFAFCLAPTHPLAGEMGVLTEATVRLHRAIVVADSARRLPARTTGLLRGQDVLLVPDMSTKYEFQVAGLGVGFLPEICAARGVSRGVLVERRVEYPKPVEQLYLGWRSEEGGRALSWWRERLTTASVRRLLQDAGSALTSRTTPSASSVVRMAR